MSELLTKIENHIVLGLDASPGFFLSMDDLKQIAIALRQEEAMGTAADEIERLRARNDALCESLQDHRCGADSRTSVRECIENGLCGCCDGLLLKSWIERRIGVLPPHQAGGAA